MSVLRALSKSRLDVGPNMTPMVDIVMCILIFFMLEMSLTTPEMFLKSNTAAIDKQGLGSGSAQLPDVRMNIRLTRAMLSGRPTTMVTAFNEKALPMNNPEDTNKDLDRIIEGRLTDRRKGISDDVQVLIVPDRDVPWQDVITIYDDCVKLQFKQVAFSPVQ